jgi:hypothetical protein
MPDHLASRSYQARHIPEVVPKTLSRFIERWNRLDWRTSCADLLCSGSPGLAIQVKSRLEVENASVDCSAAQDGRPGPGREQRSLVPYRDLPMVFVAERLIGSIRRECLDHVVVGSEAVCTENRI